MIQDGDTFSAYFKSDASVQKKGFAISFKMEEGAIVVGACVYEVCQENCSRSNEV